MLHTRIAPSTLGIVSRSPTCPASLRYKSKAGTELLNADLIIASL